MKYKIKKGDTLSKISRNLGVSVKDLAKLNNITDVNKIQTGKSLNISISQTLISSLILNVSGFSEKIPLTIIPNTLSEVK